MGRVLAPVMVNGQGPFRFILDTGANRSVLSPHLLDVLKLRMEVDSKISVHGVTGSAVLPAVHLDRLQAGALTLAKDTMVPVLAQTVLARADGILGVDGLKMARVEIDFAKDKVRIIPATGRQTAPSGFLTIPADIRHGSLLTVPARVGHITARAIIDTGAERTLGNNALREALLLSRRHGVEEQGTTVFGATPDISMGTSIAAPTIYIGEAELHDLVITFGDLHVFEMWGFERQPALLIGMDLLGSVERLIIDYRREELQVKPRS
jgi:hypothetical protein